jgi:two-component sensor histidine kinase
MPPSAWLRGAAGDFPSADLFDVECDFRTPALVRQLLGAAFDSSTVRLVSVLSLVATELVANAAQAGAGLVAVSLLPAREYLELRVVDDAPGALSRHDPAVNEPRGRGLLIVDRLASERGSTALAGGKTVWARFLLM